MINTRMTTNMRLSGLATGMDTESIIRDLMRIERMPLDKKIKEKQVWEWRQEDYRSVNTSLLALKNTTFNMSLNSSYLSKKASSSNESIVTASAGTSALNGVYSLKVTQLATAATNASSEGISVAGSPIDPTKSLYSQMDKFADQTFFAGKLETDTFTVDVNGKSLTFSYNDSLNKIMNTINSDKEAGVSFFYDNGTDKLAAASTATGTTAQLELGGDFFSSLFKIDNLAKASGQNAEFVLNGLATSREDNIFSVSGVTFNLKGLTAGGVSGAATTIEVKSDTDAVFNKIKAFVDQYNEVLTSIDSQVKAPYNRNYGPLTAEEKEGMKDAEIEEWEKTARSGLLRSDSILESILSDMRRTMSGNVDGAGSLTNLSKIGISSGAYLTNKARTLNIDEAKLRQAIENDPEAVAKLFNNESEIEGEKGIIVRLNERVSAGIKRITNRAGIAEGGYDQSVIGKTIRNIDDNIYLLEERLLRIEENYWKRFTAMERAISSMNSQSAWLESQLGGLNAQ